MRTLIICPHCGKPTLAEQPDRQSDAHLMRLLAKGRAPSKIGSQVGLPTLEVRERLRRLLAEEDAQRAIEASRSVA